MGNSSGRDITNTLFGFIIQRQNEYVEYQERGESNKGWNLEIALFRDTVKIVLNNDEEVKQGRVGRHMGNLFNILIMLYLNMFVKKLKMILLMN
jgi:hypothetical protein